MATIANAGYVFKDDGTAVSGATVTVLQADTSTSVATGTTNSSGYYSVTTTTENANAYDVKIESGASVRYRRGKDRVQMMELDIRNSTGATQGALLVANTTNSTSNKVATFAGRNSTGATNDEIYLTFEIHNAAEEVTEYARMTVVATDATNGSEDGEIQFDVMKAGTRTKVWSVSSSSSGATSFDIETSTVTMAVDDFTIKSEDDGSAAILYMFADQGDDDADKWRLQVADGGVMTYASLISSSYVTHMTITPHATVASSTVAFAGGVTIAADLTITGDDLTMGTNTSGHVLVADGTNYNPVAVGGDITMAANGTVTIASTAVETAMIAADAITGAKIADDAIDSEHYTDGSIDNAHIADDAVGLDEMAGLVRGKIIYGDASGNPAALTVGSANYVLTSDGTDISWASATTGDITGVTAGTGLTGGGTTGTVTVNLALTGLTDTAIANGDYIVFTDTTDSNATVKGDLGDVATLFAGTGLTASSSVIGVDAAQTGITSLGTQAANLAVGNGYGVVIGTATQETVSIGDGATDLVPELQVLGTAAADSSLLLAAFSTTATTAGSPIIALAKGGHGTLGSHTIVTDGEELGNIIAFGDDGSDLETPAASIQFEVDGTPGAGDMPGRILFNTTADVATAVTERIRITSSGEIGIAGANYGTDGQVLTSAGSGAAVAWEDAGGGGVSTGKAIAFSIVF